MSCIDIAEEPIFPLFLNFDAIGIRQVISEMFYAWEAMALPPTHSQSLLPNPDSLILDRIERNGDRFRLLVHVEQKPVCPLCGEVSRSRHSCYCRCLRDLPWQGVSVQLWATVGRFRCRNSSCPRKIFCERLPRVAGVYGRQTERASEIVRLIGYVAGGLPGQRLLNRLSIATSRNRDSRSGPLWSLRRGRCVRSPTIAAGCRPIPSYLEPLLDHGAGAGRAEQQLVLPPAEDPPPTSQSQSASGVSTEVSEAAPATTIATAPPKATGSLPASGDVVPRRPFAKGYQPRTGDESENDPVLATARPVSRTQTAAPATTESKRVCRVSAKTLERGLPQRLPTLSRDS